MFGFALDENGSQPRPRPQPAMLGMHISNAFHVLSNVEEQEEKERNVASCLSHRGKLRVRNIFVVSRIFNAFPESRVFNKQMHNGDFEGRAGFQRVCVKSCVREVAMMQVCAIKQIFSLCVGNRGSWKDECVVFQEKAEGRRTFLQSAVSRMEKFHVAPRVAVLTRWVPSRCTCSQILQHAQSARSRNNTCS